MKVHTTTFTDPKNIASLALPSNGYSRDPKLNNPEYRRVIAQRLGFSTLNRVEAGMLKDRSLRSNLPVEHSAVTVSEQLATGHVFDKVITKPTPLVSEDFHLIETAADPNSDADFKIDTVIPVHQKSHASPASMGESHEGAAWVRDMAAEGLGMYACGDFEKAAKIARCLYIQFSQDSQRDLINAYLGPDGKERFKDMNKKVPYTKLHIDDKGKLIPYSKPWCHHQLDAYGYAFELMAKVANLSEASINESRRYEEQSDESSAELLKKVKDIFELNSLDRMVRAKGIRNPKDQGRLPVGESDEESTFVALAKFLINIEYWDQRDAAAWEDKLKLNRTSSIAAVTSGLKEAKKYIENNPKAGIKFKNSFGEGGRDDFLSQIDRAVEHAKTILDKKVEDHPYGLVLECADDGTPDNRAENIAALFALVIADPDLLEFTENQRKAILRMAYSLMGETGFRRFPNDTYMGADYIYNPCDEQDPDNYKPGFKDIVPTSAKEAEWCMFDPYLAYYHFRQFLKNPDDLESYFIADRHVRRALASINDEDLHITKPNFETGTDRHPKKTFVSSGALAELYFKNYATDYELIEQAFGANTKLEGAEKREYLMNKYSNKWLAGENHGLNWTKIAFMMMLKAGKDAASVYEKKYGEMQQKVVEPLGYLIQNLELSQAA